MAMDRTIHVRLDAATAQALGELRAMGINPSELIREALRRRAAAARALQSHSESAGRSEEMEKRLIEQAFDPLVVEIDEQEGADDEEIWERFLAQQPKGALPVIHPWREHEGGTC